MRINLKFTHGLVSVCSSIHIIQLHFRTLVSLPGQLPWIMIVIKIQGKDTACKPNQYTQQLSSILENSASLRLLISSSFVCIAHHSNNSSLSLARPLPVQCRARVIIYSAIVTQNTVYHLKHHLNLCVRKIHHSGTSLEINTAVGFASCCIYLSTPLMLYFPYSTRGSGLSNIIKYGSA